ncbi:MAG: hypothetical protein LIO65_09070 [Odoribacter sp.]|nr:hypothetical protein [Odoribacter sp.]
MRNIISLILTICLISGVAKAQDYGNLGPDSLKTLENASIYQEFVKQNNFEDALPAWRYVFENAPQFQLRTYADGARIIQEMYQKTKDDAYIDTLMMVYDQRIKYFGNHATLGEGYALGRKGADLMSFRSNNIEAIKEAYGYMAKSFEMQGNKTEPRVVAFLFNAADQLLKQNLITKDEYLNTYLKLSEYAEAVKPNLKPEEYTNLKGTLDGLFFKAGVADCETLMGFLVPKYESDPQNKENLQDIARLLRRSDCADSEFFGKISEALYQLEPTSEAAANLARRFLGAQDIQKAEQYFKEAIDKSTDNETKAEYYRYLAMMSLSKKQYAEVKKNALEALKLNPNMGEAYMLIGQAYVHGSTSYGSDNFEKATIFWAAADKFARAKQVDPGVSAEADQWLRTCSQHFPNKEEGFFRNLQEGANYTVGGWINETTKVRYSN